ncbi:hypothetical protein [Geodermatophilus sp. CPCC 206100]|uniref:hypothetical protein n=1 Tax=Geodermatophilus sp. CPCC 206100 TaxID=3020054 RepID=UPI003B00B401
MSTRRLLGTTVAMAAVAAALRAATPDLAWLATTGLDLQRAADTVGPETLLLCAVAALAWLTWLWGLLGLVLTAASGLPGLAGGLARALSRRVLPAGARRAAALALGVGLTAGAPLLVACAPASAAPDSAAAHAGVTDWPSSGTATAGPIPDWPRAPAPPTPAPPQTSAPAQTTAPRPTPAPAPAPQPTAAPVPGWPLPDPGDHVVLRGECLWDIAAADLQDRSGREPTAGETAAAVQAWWQLNAGVIGPDPDLLLPGQVLRPPSAP